MATEALYQELILEHNRKPRNFREMDGRRSHDRRAQSAVRRRAHALGEARRRRDRRRELHGDQGCAISKASASLMTAAVKGKSRAEAEQLFDRFHELVTGKLPESEQRVARIAPRTRRRREVSAAREVREPRLARAACRRSSPRPTRCRSSRRRRRGRVTSAERARDRRPQGFPAARRESAISTISTRRRRRRSRAWCSTRCCEYYEHDNANPHRGAYALSARATERYHDARERVARFVGVKDADAPDLHARHDRVAQPRRDGVGTRERRARATRSSSRGSSITPTSSRGSSSRSRRARRCASATLTSDGRVDVDAFRVARRAEDEGRRVQSRVERARHDQPRRGDERDRARGRSGRRVRRRAGRAASAARHRCARRRLLRVQRPQDARADGHAACSLAGARCSRRCRRIRPAAT